MDWNQFHFSEPYWIWGLSIIPVLWIIYALFYKTHNVSKSSYEKLYRHIDKHLLKHLLQSDNNRNGSTKYKFIIDLIIWSILWLFLILALAGPRYDFKEVKKFESDKTLVILLDLSRSMDISDIKPTRLIRAIQEIEDILDNNLGTKIGLIAFSADAHIVTPITDDMDSIKYLLNYISTNLLHFNGSRIIDALNMADNMLNSAIGDNKSILIITDGDFDNEIESKDNIESLVKDLRNKSINTHIMGMGDKYGGAVLDNNGAFVKQNGKQVISKLEPHFLKKLSKLGNGLYLEPTYSKNDAYKILQYLENKNKFTETNDDVIKLWNERFYYLIIPVMFITLLCFRRGVIFPFIAATLLASSIMINNASADGDDLKFDIIDLFKNNQQIGKDALENNDFNKAATHFDNPYMRGIAHYKAGNYQEAEKSFSNYLDSYKDNDANSSDNLSNNNDLLNGLYNLGNSQAKQHKFSEAIETYKKLLEKNPNHEKANYNLDLVKKLLSDEQKKAKNKNKKTSDEDYNKPPGNNNDNKNFKSNKEESEVRNDDDNTSNEGDNNDNSNQIANNNETDKNSDSDHFDNNQNSDDNKNAGEEDKKDTDKQNGDHDIDSDTSDDDKETVNAKSENNEKTGEDNDSINNLNEEDINNQNNDEEKKEKDLSSNKSNDSKDDDNNIDSDSENGDKSKDINPGDIDNNERDKNADQLLKRIKSDPALFLKNQFYIESMQKPIKPSKKIW